MELAERLDRLWAAIIDRLLIVVFGVGAAIAFPSMQGSSMQGAVILLASLVTIAIVGTQIWLLTTQGQTIGKRIMGLRIVTIKDMTNGGFTTNVLMRGLIGMLIKLMPVVGVLYGLADPLAIFREDRRCIHDHIAGTCVVKIQ